MSYSRRNFLKLPDRASSSPPSAGDAIFAAPTSPYTLPAPMVKEKATFLLTASLYAAEYEARTTLWEVISMKLGLTGTNRSCNRASCGACSVLVDGMPVYSCHTLATEAAGKKILTIEGVGDEKNLHPLQRIGHTHVAADCGFCTAGWVVTAKGLLDKNLNPSADQVKAALAGHICRCSAYPRIIRTVIDSAAVLRGSKTPIETGPASIIQIKMPMVRDFSTTGGHTSGRRVARRPAEDRDEEVAGLPPENLNVVGKPMPALPEVSIPRFTGKAQYASRVWFPRSAVCAVPHLPASARAHQGPRHVGRGKDAGRALTFSRTRMRRSRGGPTLPGGFRAVPAAAAAGTESARRSRRHRRGRDRGPGAGCGRRHQGGIRSSALRIDAEGQPWLPDAPDLGHGKGNLLRARPIRPRIFRTPRGRISAATSKKDSPKRTSSRNSPISFAGGVSVPMQPSGSVAKWDGDKLTFWGMGQGIYPVRDVARGGARHGRVEDPLHQQVQRFDVRRRAHGRGTILSDDRPSREGHGPAREGHAAQGSGTGAAADQAGDHHEVPSGREEETAASSAIDHEVYVSVGDLDFGVHASVRATPPTRWSCTRR